MRWPPGLSINCMRPGQQTRASPSAMTLSLIGRLLPKTRTVAMARAALTLWKAPDKGNVTRSNGERLASSPPTSVSGASRWRAMSVTCSSPWPAVAQVMTDTPGLMMPAFSKAILSIV